MKLLKKKDSPERPERLQNQLLFWLAAALAPESMPWYSGGYSNALLGQIDEARRSAHAASPTTVQASDEPVEEQRKAA